MFSRIVKRTAKVSAVSLAVGTGGLLAFSFRTLPKGVPQTEYNKTALTPNNKRENHLKNLKTDLFDVLIIGGGATGSSVALDCASRGLKVALVEGNDFGSGTSSRSTKLLHGGVRYLRDAFFKMDFPLLKLVWEALRERAHMLHQHPFLSQPISILMPVYTYWDFLQYWVGLKSYEFLGEISTLFHTGLPTSYSLTPSNCLHFLPLLKDKNLKGGVMYYDGQQNDTRTCIYTALTAATEGYLNSNWTPATICNYVEVSNLILNEQGKVCGAKVVDRQNNDESFVVSSKVVINCTGPFCDSIRKKADPKVTELVMPAMGSHVTLPPNFCPKNLGILIPETEDKRVLFILPWQGITVAGTTDKRTDLKRHAVSDLVDLNYIVKETAKYLDIKEDLLVKNVKATWAGIRPLVKDPKKAASNSGTAALSRDHEVIIDESNGLVSIVGGKWTTCRLMADDVINKALKYHADKISPLTKSSRTFGIFLYGCHAPENSEIFNFSVFGHGKYSNEGLCEKLGVFLETKFNLDPSISFHIANNYGTNSARLLEFGKKLNLNSPVVPSHPTLKSEILWAFEDEMACSLVDALAHRTRLALIDPKAVLDELPQILSTVGDFMKWTPKKRLEEEKVTREFLKTLIIAPEP